MNDIVFPPVFALYLLLLHRGKQVCIFWDNLISLIFLSPALELGLFKDYNQIIRVGCIMRKIILLIYRRSFIKEKIKNTWIRINETNEGKRLLYWQNLCTYWIKIYQRIFFVFFLISRTIQHYWTIENKFLGYWLFILFYFLNFFFVVYTVYLYKFLLP